MTLNEKEGRENVDMRLSKLSMFILTTVSNAKRDLLAIVQSRDDSDIFGHQIQQVDLTLKFI